MPFHHHTPSKNSPRQTRTPRHLSPRGPIAEVLEGRTLLSIAPAAGVVASHGYGITQFAASPAGASQPDSIAVGASSVFVGYQNGGLPDGSDGKSSTIAQYTLGGTLVQTFSVPGHNDGLKIDPATGFVWSMQNEDANPNLVIINPTAATQTQYSFAAAPLAGGGYDDIAFLNGKVYFTASNPANNPNTQPAVVQATLVGTTVTVSTVLLGNATAILKHKQVTLNLQDPDSMTTDPSGRLVFTSQSDNELITVANPGASDQSASVLNLTSASKKPVSVDDTLFRPSGTGEVLLSDTKAGIVYAITTPATKNLVLSAAPAGQVGELNIKTGHFKSVISGLSAPHGLAFVPFGLTVAKGYAVRPLATGPAGSTQPDSITTGGSHIFVGYQNGGAPDGSGGATSTIAEFDSVGNLLKTWTVAGHNDGLKIDPSTGLVWSMQNEDANPSLVLIDPVAGTQTPYAFAAAPLAGGGYDDITFVGGKVFFSSSNPANNPNTGPAIVQATLSGSTVTVSTVLLGNASATSIKHKPVTLNLQDPDSMTADPAGDLVMTSQADDELVIVKNPGAANQSVTLVPLTDAKKTSISVDDTLFVTKGVSTVLVTDTGAGIIYAITGNGLKGKSALSADPDTGVVGKTDVKTGRFTPIVTGLRKPHGLASM